jgi:hypothetical protein
MVMSVRGALTMRPVLSILYSSRMTSPGGKPDPPPRQASPSKLWALLGIVCVAYTVVEWGHTLYEVMHDPEPSAFAKALKATVRQQLEQLEKVDSAGLAGVFVDTLETNTCNWIFQCTHIQNEHSLLKGGGLSNAVIDLTSAPPPRPQLFYHPGGPIYIPTVHTLLGLPKALWETAAAIWRAGVWAVLVFGSCTVIWAVVLIRMVKGGGSPWPVYAIVVGAPVWITLMVMLVQGMGELALHRFGPTVASSLFFLPLSGATVVLLIQLPHLVEAPHELRKALRAFRR